MALSLRDFEKLKRLRHTFDLNYRVTQLYSAYLTHAPTLLQEGMVEALTKDGSVRTEDALVALLSLAFGLKTNESEEDLRIEREYLAHSVRILHAEDYYNDPYYRTVHIPEVTCGRFSFKTEEYPPYRAMICDDIHPTDSLREVPPLGFFQTPFRFPAVLEDGNEWMTLTPVDVDTCRDAIEAAHGHVVTFGLGLGYYAFMVARKPSVTRVTVVERSADVIRLFREHLLPQFSDGDKILIVEDDAFSYAEHTLPNVSADYVFVDTWRDASDGYPMYRQMKVLEHLTPNATFSYWIEGWILSRMRALTFEEIWDTQAAVPHGSTSDPEDTFDTLLAQLCDDGLRRTAEKGMKYEKNI